MDPGLQWVLQWVSDNPSSVFAFTTGLFFAMSLYFWARRGKKEPPRVYKRYVTEVPSKLIIEEESSS